METNNPLALEANNNGGTNISSRDLEELRLKSLQFLVQNGKEDSSLKDFSQQIPESSITAITDFFLKKGKHESCLNKNIKKINQQDELEDWQRVALAPGNAIESVFTTITSLFTEEGRAEISRFFAFLSNIPENSRLLFSVFWDKLNAMQKTAFLVELSFSFVIGVKVFQVLQKLFSSFTTGQKVVAGIASAFEWRFATAEALKTAGTVVNYTGTMATVGQMFPAEEKHQ